MELAATYIVILYLVIDDSLHFFFINVFWTVAGKGILIFAFQWMMPIWAISLLIASGTIKLPFSSPFLDDLLLWT